MTTFDYCTVVFMLSLLLLLGSENLGVNATRLHPNTIIKTIESKNGEIVDCVDIYAQPAFSDPLLKNHTIQMRPSLSIEAKGRRSSLSPSKNVSDDMFINWYKNGEHCPEGSVPILRSLVASPFNKTLPPNKSRPNMLGPDGLLREYCIVDTKLGNYYGGSAEFSIWKPTTYHPEHSLAQVWILGGIGHDANTIEAGWIVRGWANDFEPALFIYWTRDFYSTTGCYNLECPGFVQTSHIVALGTHLTPSVFLGDESYLSINVPKDRDSGNWWLKVNGNDIGYWPAAIFTNMANSATAVHWGGEIVNTMPNGHHTETQMGSGSFAEEGSRIAAYVKHLGYFDEDSNFVQPLVGVIDDYASRPECYSLQRRDFDFDDGINFYYGGPGGQSANCI